jgi:hypothetical protein
MGVGQPCMQRCKSDLGPIAEEQKDKCQVEQRGIEIGRARNQACPNHSVGTLSDHGPACHVDEDGTEQGKRDTDAAKNEVFPRCFERLVGAVDADHEHGGERRELDCDPYQPDIIGDERKVHGKHQDLIHRVIEAQERRGEPSDRKLVPDIARAEHAGREAYERGEHDENIVEIVDVKIWSRARAAEEQRQGDKEGGKRCDHVDPGGQAVAR